jgi:hypothetical protein
MTHLIDITTSKIEENSQKLINLDSTLKKMKKHYYEIEDEISQMEDIQKAILFLSEAEQVLNSIATGVTDLEQGIIDGIHHKMSPRLINPKMVREMLKQVYKNTPENYKLAIAMEKIGEFYVLPVKVMIQGNRLVMVTNLPAFKPSSLVDIYHHEPIPMWTEKEEIATIITATRSILAIDYAQTIYMELDEADVEKCLKIENLHLCPHLTIMHKDKESCLRALFLSQTKRVHQWCQIHIQKRKETVGFHLMGNKYQITTRKEQPSSMLCANNRTNILLRVGTNEISIPDNCSFTSPTLLITSSPESIPTLIPLVYPNFLSELNNLTVLLKARYPNLDVVPEDIYKGINRFPKSHAHIPLQELVEAAEDAKRELQPFWIPHLSLGTATIALLGTISIVSFILYRFYKFKRQQHVKAPTNANLE